MIDSHCHIAGEEFAADLHAVVARAQVAGVSSALCILGSEDEEELARADLVKAAWPAVRYATGIHPHHAGEFDGRIEHAVDRVRRAAGRHGACAIGEIGLDYHYDFSPRDVQQGVFRAQIRLARELSLPIVVHTREATSDTFAILREEGQGAVRGIFHCFTGDEAMARAALDIDFHLSFAGIVTFPKADAIRAAAKLAPANRILAETDAPYLAPVPHRGERNEPAYVVRVAEALAEVRSADVRDLGARMDGNFRALFG